MLFDGSLACRFEHRFCTVCVPFLYCFCTAFVFMYCFCTLFVPALKRIVSISPLRGSLLRGSLLRGSLSPTFPTFAKNTCFTKLVITRAQNGSPDMILTAFDVKFHEKKDEIPPRACNPSYTFIYLHIPSYIMIYLIYPSVQKK